MSNEEKRLKVGVGVIIYKDGKVLLGKRKNAHGEGTWSLPGGHLEFGEKVEECAKREVLEEVGIKIQNVRMGTFTNDVFKKEDKHYITVYAISDYKSGNVEIKEPEKCGCWKWFSPSNLPKPLFVPLKNLKKQKGLLI